MSDKHESGGGPGVAPGPIDDERGRWFTDAELRARDERIIMAAVRLGGRNQAVHWGPHDFDAVIAAAEVD